MGEVNDYGIKWFLFRVTLQVTGTSFFSVMRHKFLLCAQTFSVLFCNAPLKYCDVPARVATTQGKQGKQGIWFLLFPNRENTGNFVLTQGKFANTGKIFGL